MKPKRLFCALLSALLILSALPVFSSAADTLKVYIRGSAPAHDTVEIYLASSGGYMTSCRFLVGYSPELEFVSYEPVNTDDFLFVAPLAAGDRAVVYYACPKTVHNADFAKIIFRVKETDKKTVSFTFPERYYLYAGKTADTDVAALAGAVYEGTDIALPAVTAVVASPVKSTFRTGETGAFDKKDLSVTALYETGETGSVSPSRVTVGGKFDGGKAGLYYLTCSLEGKSCSFTVQVYDEDIGELKIKQLPAKTSFAYGEAANFSGLRLTAVNTDGSTRTLARTDVVISGYDPYISGTQTVTVSYCNESVCFPVTVAEKFKKGDVDNNGVVDVSDARLALRAAIGLEYYPIGTPAYLAACVDADEGIQVTDARLILRAAIGLDKF